MVNEESITRIDAARARKLAQLMITKAETFDESPKLLDLSVQSPADLLKAYSAKLASYDTAPFDVTGDALRFHAGGYTVWSGYPGTGKTTILRQLICHLLFRGKPVFAAHLEEDPGDTLIRTAGVAFGTSLPTQQQLQWFIDWYIDKFRIWGMIGLASWRDIFGVLQHQAEKGIKHAVIDSLMCLDVKSDDYEAQRLFANQVSTLVRKTKMHLHLVAHPRKVVSSEQEPDINDVAGSSDLIRLADNVLFIRKGVMSESYDSMYAMQILIKKQRHDPAYTGNISGWFNRSLRQFKTDQWDQVATQYLPKQAYD